MLKGVFRHLAEGISEFSESLDSCNIDDGKLAKVRDLCEFLSTLANSLPSSSLTTQLWGDYKDLGKFGWDMTKVAIGMGNFGNTLDKYDFDEGKIERAEGLAKFLVELQKELPDSSLLTKLTGGENGYKNLGKFGIDMGKVADGMGKFGDTLSKYDFDEGKIDRVHKLGDFMTEIQNKLPDSSTLTKLTGGSEGYKNLGKFGTDLIPVAAGMGAFGAVLALFAFDEEKISRVAALGDFMVTIQNKLPDSSELTKLTGGAEGYKDLGEFGRNLVPVAEGMGKFGQVLEKHDFDLGKIMKVAMLGMFIASIQNMLPETGGVEQFWEGHKDLGTFGWSLIPVALGMGAFATVLMACQFDDGKITAAENLLKFLAALSGDVPLDKGFMGKIFGGNSGLDNFGTGMEKVGYGLHVFMSHINGTSFSGPGYETAKKAIEFLRDLANDLPPDAGLLGLLFGGGDGLGSFSDNIAHIGQGLGTFSENIENINRRNITTAMIALEGIASISSIQGFQDSSTLTKFGEAVESLGGKLKSYCEDVSTTDLTLVYSSVACVERLIEAINNTKDINADGIGAFKEAVTSLGTTDVTGLLAPLVAQSDAITSATSQISSAFSAGLTGDTSGIGDAGVTMVTALATAINDNLGVVTTAAEGVANEVYTGIQSKGDPTIQAMLGIMNETLKQVTDKQESFGTESTTCAENVLTGLGSKNDGISKVFTTSISSALTSVNRYADFYNRAVFNASGVLNGMGSKNSSIKTVFSSPLSGAISNVSGYSSKFSSAGSTLGSAFAQSLSSKITNIVNDVQRRIRELADWVNGQLRSLNSAISQARSNAAKANKPNASATKDSRQQIMSNVEDSVKEGFTNGLSKVAAFIDNGMISQPTIVPVMDLSQIQNGVATINSMFASGGFNAISASMSGRSNMVTNADIVTAINNLEKSIDGIGDTYNINGITYDDGSNIATAVKMLTRAAMMERRG